MPKPYSQDLRDRVIDAVQRGELSRRAAARRYEISESIAVKWLERVERARESLSVTAAIGRPS
jgi:transposase